MQITRLALTNWLAHQHLNLPIAPLTVVCGANGAGKSSVADAIAFGLTGELRRITAAGERDALLTSGAVKGAVRLEFGGEPPAHIERAIKTGKMQAGSSAPAMREGALSSALPYLLDPRRFGAATPDQRRAILLDIMRVRMDAEGLAAELLARGAEPALVKALPVTETLTDWRDRAKQRQTEARADWKAQTGEAYGEVKAETWQAIGPAPASEEDAAALATAERAAADRLGAAQRALGEHDGLAKAAAEAARRAYPGTAPEQIAENERMVKAGEAREVVAKAKALAATEALADVLRRRPTGALDCPHCGGSVQHIGPRLEPYMPPANPASEADEAAARLAVKETAAAVEALRRSISAMAMAARHARDAIALSESAAKAPPPEAREALVADVADAERAAAAARQAVAQAAADRAAHAAAATATAKARRAHAIAQGWAKLAAELAPDGIPGELLARALDPFNAALRAHADATGWPQVAVGRDMSIMVGTLDYRLRSRSEQWRADAMIGAAIAEASRVRLLVLDEMDLLQVNARGGAMGWLYGLVTGDAPILATVIVLATMREAPKAPPDVAVHWLGAPQ